jgi:hypothetical protein
MTVGTKSVLFGVHNPIWHGPTVWLAYYKLYGREAFKLPVIVACFVHDIGYWAKPNMDGPEGDTHPYLGAAVMHWLFDGWEVRQSGPLTCKTRSWKWYGFSLYHSRHLAKAHKVHYSRLAVADKLATALTPWWFYLPVATLSGEIDEYMERAKIQIRANEAVNAGERAGLTSGQKRAWYSCLQQYLTRWAWAHRDGEKDTWTADRHN